MQRYFKNKSKFDPQTFIRVWERTFQGKSWVGSVWKLGEEMERRKEGKRGGDLWRLWPSLGQMVSVELSFRKQTRWPRPWSPVLALTAHLFSSLITHRPVQTAKDLLPLCWKMINSAFLPPPTQCHLRRLADAAGWGMSCPVLEYFQRYTRAS